MTAILFGSISTVADTSEIQRDSFNQAFSEHGLDWEWDIDTYRSMLDSNGGQDRIAQYAERQGVDVDAAAVHATKSSIYQKALADSGVTPRPGVVEVIAGAKEQGMKLGLVTTTLPENIAALMDALAPEVDVDDFDVVVDMTQVDKRKPDAEAYDLALQRLGVDSDDAVAIEDNLGGLQSAQAAGVPVVAFPNENTKVSDFSAASTQVDTLDLAQLTELVPGA